MTKIPRIIGHLTFKSITEAEKYFRNILDSANDFVPLEGEVFRDVEALLCCHEHAEQKIGSGIENLFVAPDPERKSRCFQIYRSDGSFDHFGYHKAVKGFTLPRVRFMQASREAVKQDVDDFKATYFKEHADQNGMIEIHGYEAKYPLRAVHTDHANPPFRAIVDEFIAREHIDPAVVEYDYIGRFGTVLKDEALADRFRAYHKSRAVYQLLPSPDNLKKAWQARADRAQHVE